MQELKTMAITLLGNPEVAAALIVLLTAILVRTGLLRHSDIITAQEMHLKYGATISEITDKTRLTAEKAKLIVNKVTGSDKTSKKIQRTARKVLHKWLGL